MGNLVASLPVTEEPYHSLVLLGSYSALAIGCLHERYYIYKRLLLLLNDANPGYDSL